MKMEIPKFLYHGTTKFHYDSMAKHDFEIPSNKLECFKHISQGIYNAFQRCWVFRYVTPPVLLIIDSSKNSIESSQGEFYVLKRLNPDGHLAIPFDIQKIDDQSAHFVELSKGAKELSDFLD